MRALDFSIRQFHYRHLTAMGSTRPSIAPSSTPAEFGGKEMTPGRKGEPVPQIASPPLRSSCWSMLKADQAERPFLWPVRPRPPDAGEVRLLRFNTFLRSGKSPNTPGCRRIAEKKAQTLVQEVDHTLASIRVRLEAAKPR